MMEPQNVMHDEHELSDLEDATFLPSRNVVKRTSRWRSILARRIPPRILYILIFALVLLLLWRAWANYVADTIPAESLALSKALADSLSGSNIPSYVLTYAPLVFLDRRELFYPSDMATHVSSSFPTSNFTVIPEAPDPLTLDNLDALNDLQEEETFLTSVIDLVTYPKYLYGREPNTKTLKTNEAISCAVIVVEKEDDIVDAFYMYFYSFNAGPVVFWYEIGNHMGDWEHNMIRFQGGKPSAIWYSQHEYGEAFKWEAVEKIDNRPVVYSAKGSHANYARSGSIDLHKNDEGVPAHIVFDHTSRGLLWDPSLSAYYYAFSMTTSRFTPAMEGTPVNYLYSSVRWGDQQYPDEKDAQSIFHGYRKWTGGPQGPIFKHLDRENVCLPNRPECIINDKAS